MVWPGRVVLGALGRRTDEVALVWAVGLSSRWESELNVVAGYQPPVGMFPHIVTAREIETARRRAREQLTARILEAIDDLTPPIEVRLTLVTHSQLAHTIVRRSERAGLVLVSIAPSGLLSRRHRSRARWIAEQVTCPVSLGPGRAVDTAEPGPVH